MNKMVCNYVTVRFLPYRETGEFANIGVVVFCPQTDYFDYRLELRKHRRIRHFFPELDHGILKAALLETAKRLNAHKSAGLLTAYGNRLSDTDATIALETFRDLIRKREALVHFGEAGTLLTQNPEQTLNELFERMVERQFAKDKEYQESEMRKRLTACLKEWKLKRYYKIQKVGDSEIHITLPFVHSNKGKPAKAIKPIDLGHDEPMEIYEHGGAWCNRMKRLSDRNLLPAQTLFAVRLPGDGLIKQQGAAHEICRELEQLKIEVISIQEDSAIRQWAKISKST